MSTKSGQFVYLDDGTVAQQVQIAGTSDNTGGALGVNVKQSDAIVPVDIQNRLASTIQTHTSVSVAPSGFNTNTNWIDSDGYTELNFTVQNDNSSASFSLNVVFSNDGTNQHGGEVALTSAAGVSGATRSGGIKCRARYFKFVVINNDAGAAHTLNAWAYLTA